VTGPTLTAARQVADAVLYEGYLLYPYRASSMKNHVRWQFGVLGPEGAAAAGEPPAMSAEVMVESRSGATLDVYLRFLQVQSRVVQRRADGGWSPVDELLVDGSRWIAFHEAVSREIPLLGIHLDGLADGRQLDVNVPAGEDIEELQQDGHVVGRLVRTRWGLTAAVTLTTRGGHDSRLSILTVAVENRTQWPAPDGAGSWTERDVAARYSFVGTHLLLAAGGAAFIPLLDPPDWAVADTSACTQSRCWPVRIADDAGGDAVLVSPIILGDHPTIAPESAGDLFDATEIDEILTLRIMTMTDDEKAAARGTDPRAAAILARSDSMGDDIFERLHGARRDAEPLFADADIPTYGDDVPWWDAEADARAEPTKDVVMVAGQPVAKGTRVRLRPSRRADAQDLFFAGQTAIVTRVYFDVDGATHVGVVLEDDPGRDLYDTTGRFYYFAPDEVEPLPARAETGERR